MTTECTRCRGQLEHGDLRCAVCALPVRIEAAGERSARAQVLRCTDCNAAVAFSVKAQAPHCAFCGAIMAIEQLVDPLEVAEVRIPFAVERDAAAHALRGWLGRRGFFAPKSLRDDAVLETLSPLCWAGWVCSAQAQVAWTADSDEGAKRSAWAPHAGQVPMRFEAIVVPATRGLTAAECSQLVPYYDLRHAVPVAGEASEDVVEDVVIESFDAQRSAARAQVQRAIEATAKTRVEPHIPGRKFRNVHVACLLQGQTTQRMAFPAWVLAYRYRGRPYRAIIHGQRGELVFGRAPIDRVKLAIVVASALAAIALVVALVLLGAPRP